MTRSLSALLPVNPETLGDMLGVAAIGLVTVAGLWLPALIAG